MRTVKSLIVVTGAGISVSAGCELPAVYWHYPQGLCFERVRRVYTQNIDGIERQLHGLHPSVPLPFRKPWPRCIQVHGDIRHAYCVVCRSIVALEPESFQGSRPPSCRSCASRQRRAAAIGVLRPRIRLYDQDDGAIDDEAIQLVVADDSRAPLDALLVVGTALRIPGAARLVDKLLASVRLFADGGVTAWVNPLVQPPTSLASRFDLKVVVEAAALVDMVESIS
ncbi:DHS-like NAD/FAD-binding domain-containing protein [Nemania sp. NC0429]|nr:DHS-like NAD/FAD-binding domain-containing protein [Nemania sp. NC0429]